MCVIYNACVVVVVENKLTKKNQTVTIIHCFMKALLKEEGTVYLKFKNSNFFKFFDYLL